MVFTQYAAEKVNANQPSPAFLNNIILIKLFIFYLINHSGKSQKYGSGVDSIEMKKTSILIILLILYTILNI